MLPLTPTYHFAFGDEAGDTGLKFDRGSSSCFVLAVALTNEPDSWRAYVQDFRRSLGLNGPGEVSFHHSPDRNRLAFLSGLASLDVGGVRFGCGQADAFARAARLGQVGFLYDIFHRSVIEIDPWQAGTGCSDSR